MLLGLAVLSCNKEIGNELPAPPQGDMVTIKAAFVGDELSKVGARDGFSWTWSQGDEISVASETGSQNFRISSGAGSKSAEFTGKAVEGTAFNIQYPAGEVASASWEGQVQNGNGSVDHLKYNAILENVDQYTTFSFSDEWAASHGGTMKQTGLLKIIMSLPDTVATVSKVTVSSNNPVFYSGNGDTKVKKIELQMQNTVPDSGHSVTAWMTTSWNAATVASGESLTVTVNIGERPIERTMDFTRDGVLMPGKINVFEIDGSAWSYGSNYSEGKGTESSPWVIYTLDELLCVRDDLVSGGIRYFKLGADIDMAGVEWKPLNGVTPYDKQICFDGDGHTLSNFSISSASDYPSLFGVLYGTCKNLNVTNANINTPTASTVGIIGGYGGTSGKPAVVENVHVQGSITAGGTVGGLFGNTRNCTIDRCSANVTMDVTGQKIGGLVGCDKTEILIIRNSWTSGSLVSASSICGGIVGDLTATGSSLYNCYSTMTVKTQFCAGGIIGRAVAGQKASKSNSESYKPENHIEKCIAWNDELSSNCPDVSEHYSNGAVIGASSRYNYLVDCVRKAGMIFNDCPKNAELGGYEFFDQDNSDPDHALVQGAGTYATAYHGKASAAGESLSQVAQRLGWSSEIWDFSASVPTLK